MILIPSGCRGREHAFTLPTAIARVRTSSSEENGEGEIAHGEDGVRASHESKRLFRLGVTDATSGETDDGTTRWYQMCVSFCASL